MWLSTSYRSIVQSKQAQRKESLSIALTAVTDSDLQHDYLHATASEIVGHIEKDEWTASEILEAYIARSILAQETTNCLTEILFKQAREDAKALDEEFANTNQLRGPLHGVPVSFKDIYDMKGYDSTLGYTLYANRPRQVDAHLVQLIRKAGGIPFVKTNVSQTMFFFECSNPLWGRTLSPHNAQFSPGGSSGGEAALLAMDGSALGWGSDIGGSVRIPASYCGLYSLKPSGMRINKSGITGCLPGFDGVSDVLGPMGRSVNDVELACRVVFGQQGPDYGSAPLPYREVKIPDKLRFGYYISDRFVKASPACQRAVLETVGALRRVGHECVEVEVPEHSKPLELFVGLASADGYETLLSPVGSDPMDSGLLLVVLGPKLFGWIRSLVSWFTRTWFGDYIFSRVLLRSRKKTVREYWKTVVERDEYTRLFYEKVWDRNGLDGIIAPVQALPALPHGASKLVTPISTSTSIYNVINCPVGVVPVTRVDAIRDRLTAEWSDPRSGTGHGSLLFESSLYRKGVLGGYYDAERMNGMPVGVQIVGRRWEDENVIEMMKVVDSALGSRAFGPGSWQGQKAV